MAGRALKDAVYIVGAKRTAFGAYGGSLANVSATQMQITATQGALQQANLAPDNVDTIVVGNVIQSDPASIYSRFLVLINYSKVKSFSFI